MHCEISVQKKNEFIEEAAQQYIDAKFSSMLKKMKFNNYLISVTLGKISPHTNVLLIMLNMIENENEI